MKRQLIYALGIAAFAIACHPGKAPVSDDFSRWVDGKADGFTDLKVVGSLSYGQTSDPISYTSSPLYRGFTFAGHSGDSIQAWVRSKDGDAVAWLLDDKLNVLGTSDDAPGTTDSAISLKLSQSGTFYILFREYGKRSATFVVTLKGDGAQTCICDPNVADCNDNDGDDDDHCIPCTPGKQCVPTNPCHGGAMDCGNGANCADNGSVLADGTPCGSGQVCVAGQCGSQFGIPAGKIGVPLTVPGYCFLDDNCHYEGHGLAIPSAPQTVQLDVVGGKLFLSVTAIAAGLSWFNAKTALPLRTEILPNPNKLPYLGYSGGNPEVNLARNSTTDLFITSLIDVTSMGPPVEGDHSGDPNWCGWWTTLKCWTTLPIQ